MNSPPPKPSSAREEGVSTAAQDHLPDLWIGIPDLVLSKPSETWLNSKRVAGVILFRRNFQDKKQLKDLCQQIKFINPNIQIGVDQEGGPVQRFTGEFTRLKSSEEIGSIYNLSAIAGLKASEERGLIMARELKEVGIDLSFAPVIDLTHLGSNVLRGRTYHANPDVVAELALVEIKAMQSLGLTPVIKHFPGHGGVSADTHLEEAVDIRNLEIIIKTDLKPFKICIDQNIPALMASWVKYPGVDSMPACFSQIWLQEILRKKLNFQVKIFSDDMGMQAAKYFSSPKECIEKAKKAGCDYVLLCNDFNLIDQVISE